MGDIYTSAARPNGDDSDNTLLFKIARQLDGRISVGGTARTLAGTSAAVDGSVAAGARSVTFSSNSSWVGTVAGATFPASTTVTINAPLRDTLAAIAYTRSAGTLNIFTLT